MVIDKGGVVVPAGRRAGRQRSVGGGGVVVPLPAPDPGRRGAVQFGAADTIWTKTVVGWLILSVVFLVLSVQFVSPTRRWRLRRGPSAVEEAA